MTGKWCGAANSKLKFLADGSVVANGGVFKDQCLVQEPGTGGGTSIGWGFVTVLFVVGACYVGVGALLGKRQGRYLRSLDVSDSGTSSCLTKILAPHPHWSHWRELQSLVHDGIDFVRRSGARHEGNFGTPRSSDVHQRAFDSHARERGRKHHRSGGGNSLCAGGSGGAKESTSGDMDKRSRINSSSDEGGGKVALLKGMENYADPTEQQTQVQQQSSPILSTSSAGGGRWIHVPT